MTGKPGPDLVDLILRLRRLRSGYRLTKWCLYLAVVRWTVCLACLLLAPTLHVFTGFVLQHIAMQTPARTKEAHSFLTELLAEDDAPRLPQTLSAALPATLLRAAEFFSKEGELLMSMRAFDAMQRLNIKPEQRSIELVCARTSDF